MNCTQSANKMKTLYYMMAIRGRKMINEKRPAQLLQYLLRVREATMHQLIDHFQLSKRQICYDLDKINHWLTGKKLPEIEYKKKTGWPFRKNCLNCGSPKPVQTSAARLFLHRKSGSKPCTCSCLSAGSRFHPLISHSYCRSAKIRS